MKAIAMISGGLDSLLAARLIQQQGIEIIPFYFSIPFCHKKEDTARLGEIIAANLKAPLHVIVLSDEYLEIIKNPRYGFGANMNPCIDCKILMLRKARESMVALGASFVVTGEVLGQRPMSQHRQALNNISRYSDWDGFVVRPLCAQLLAETIPEKEGWIDRKKLLRLNGRGRRMQFSLAKDFGLENYGQPAGGCLLTDEKFSDRVKDLLAHGELTIPNVEALKIGRHFRLNKSVKLIIARTEAECRILEAAAVDGDYILLPAKDLAGPSALCKGNVSEDALVLSARMLAAYCDLAGCDRAEIRYRLIGEEVERFVHSIPLERAAIDALRL